MLRKQCSKCKIHRYTKNFYRSKSCKSGLRSECKFCTVRDVIQYNKEHREERNKYRNTTPKPKYNRYKKDAKRKNRVFDLTFEQFMKFWQEPCYYCGDVVKTVGLDRLDSKIGYVVSNLVSACEICNRMKRTYSLELFLEKCYKIVIRHTENMPVY